MGRKTKIWLITAASLAVLGCIIFGGAMTVLNWDFTKLGTTKYETNSYAIEEAIADIKIVGKTANVILQPCEDGEISVICYEQTRAKHEVTMKDGVLEIRVVDKRKWYDHIGISFGSPKITVSIPQGQYGALSVRTDTGKVDIPEEFGFETVDISVSTGDVTCAASAAGEMKIKTSTGDISLHNSSAGSLKLSVSTGKITAQGITCTDGARFKASTGDLLLKNVMVEKAMLVETNTGKVKFDGCDAGEITVKTDTGSVTGSLLSPKIFFAQSDTGKVDVPKTTTGGKCEITTDTGSIRITIA